MTIREFRRRAASLGAVVMLSLAGGGLWHVRQSAGVAIPAAGAVAASADRGAVNSGTTQAASMGTMSDTVMHRGEAAGQGSGSAR